MEHLPGLTVLVVVLVLLRGITGTRDAIGHQIETLVSSFLGTGDGLGEVLLHTLPLAIAAAVATFAISRRMLTFESFGSVFVLACIIIVGASVGGFLRGLVPREPTRMDDSVFSEAVTPLRVSLNESASGEPLTTGVRTSIVRPNSDVPSSGVVILGDQQLQPIQSGAPLMSVTSAPAKSTTALDQLRSVDWLGQPDVSKIPRGAVEPLHLLPETGGAFGIVLKAANQILGYLVAYQLRLFLAAIVAGSWVGWSLHVRMQTLHEEMLEEESVPDITDSIRRAA